MQEHIEDVALHETAQERYLSYALSVITSRALPDVRDGLKPVQRRILYAMYSNLHLLPDAKHKKSAAVVGEVMAKLHPHGDQSIYDAMARMAQDFMLRYPLVDGQGNFGSIDGDNPAAMRYTEARLRHIAVELLSELTRETVDVRPNYDGTLTEPVVLPAQLPNLLINGAAGIAVGMATNIPPHNLGEVVDALMALIDSPELMIEDLVGIIQGPDFPTGGSIQTDRAGLLELYKTGQGPVEVRGEYRLEKEGQRQHIVITSVPFGLNKATLVAEIAEHIVNERVPQLVDVRDESTDEVRVVLELKRGADPDAAMAYLYKRTPLQLRFNVNLTALCPMAHGDGCEPRRLNLREILDQFLAFRLQVVRRRLQHDLRELERRIHILQGFARIYEALDEALALIRASADKDDARQRLMARFLLDHDQAEAVLETKLFKLAQLEINAIRTELADKEAKAQAIREQLASEHRLWELIKGELASIREAYGDARRTQISGPAPVVTFSAEHYIVNEDAFVMVTREGWFKRQKSYTDRATVRVREGDEVGWVLPASTRETLIVFTDRGKAYSMRVADVPQTTGHGEPLQTRFEFADGEVVVGAISTDTRALPKVLPEALAAVPPGEPKPPYAVAISRAGKSIRFSLEAFTEPSTVTGRLFMRLESGFLNDGVVAVFTSAGTETVTLATRRGRVLLFPVDEINVLSGAGKGVLAVKLEIHDWVLGFELTDKADEGLEVETNRGRVEVLRPSRYNVTHRGNMGKELLKVGHLVRAARKPVEVLLPRPVLEGTGSAGAPLVEGAPAPSDPSGQPPMAPESSSPEASRSEGHAEAPVAVEATPPEPAPSEEPPTAEPRNGKPAQGSLFGDNNGTRRKP